MPLTYSPALQALGYALINSLWQFALLWLIYVVINKIFKLSSGQKYIAGYGLQTAGFVWFAATFINYYNSYANAFAAFSLPPRQNFNYFTLTYSATSIEKFFIWLNKTEQLLPYLSVSYLVLLLFLSGRYFYAYSYTQALRKKGLKEMEFPWQTFVQDLSAKLSIHREVKIFLSEIVSTPLTVGFFKPLILIPVASINNLTAHQAEAVILHELAHIKRYDYLFNLFLALIETTLFFNPFMRLISRQIQRERENCCDDFVLQYNYHPADYARALLHIASCQSRLPLLALKATDDKQILLTRVKRMIERKENIFFNFKHQLLALFVMTVVLGLPAFLNKPPVKKPANAFFSSNSPLKNISKKVIPVSGRTSFISDTTENLTITNVRLPKTDKTADENTIDLFKSPKQENTIQLQEKGFSEIEKDNLLLNKNEDFSENQIQDFDKINEHPLQLTSTEASNDEVILEEQKQNLFEKENKKLLVNQENILNEVKKALVEIKAVRQKQLPANILLMATLGNIKIRKLEKELSQSFKTQDKKDELALLLNEIQKEIEDVNPQHSLSLKETLNTDFDFQLPSVVSIPSPPEKPHSFSFEISSKAKTATTLFVRKNEPKHNGNIKKTFSFPTNKNNWESQQPFPPAIEFKREGSSHLRVIRI